MNAAALPDLAFEAGLLGFALGLFHYGLAVKALNKIIRSKSPLWRMPLAGALVFVGVAALHAWGRFGLSPRIAELESRIQEAAAGLRMAEMEVLQARLEEVLGLLGNIRDLSFAGILLGSLTALAAGLSFLRATSK